MKNYKLYFFLFVLTCSVLSCQRTIFQYENQETKSIEKIELRKEQEFSYFHKNEKGRLNARGKYKIEEDKIVLTFYPMDRKLEYLPLNDLSVNIERIGAYTGTQIEALTIRDFHSGEKLTSSIIVKGYAKGAAVIEAKRSFDGVFFFSTEHKIEEIELSCFKCCPLSFKLEETGIFRIELIANIQLGTIGIGCALYEGPRKELLIQKEKGEIMELHSIDYDKKRYVLKEKK